MSLMAHVALASPASDGIAATIESVGRVGLYGTLS
jgi:hypothetical protein